MEYGEVRLRRGEDRGLRQGAVRVYDNQVSWVDETCADGGVVQVTGHDGTFLGLGFFNSRSKILVRLLTRKLEPIDRAFLRRRIENAWMRRKQLGFDNACRVVFGEADGLPGLTVDKFGEYLSFQIVSLGMALWQDTIVSILAELFHPRGICQRNDLPVREKEGLPLVAGCVYGAVPERVTFREHDAWMEANLLGGQKTGHFLDQQENRGRIRPYCAGGRVLDLCCHTGGFSVHAALYGAAAVTAVDVSGEALDMLQANARRNGVEEKIRRVKADAFDYLKARQEAGDTYDLVICDPPAFAKSRKAIPAAYRGYQELNRLCMQVLKPGGYLASFSCSQGMTPPLFLQMLQEAAGNAGRQALVLEALMQSRDHPAALFGENGWYLKGYLLQVL